MTNEQAALIAAATLCASDPDAPVLGVKMVADAFLEWLDTQEVGGR